MFRLDAMSISFFCLSDPQCVCASFSIDYQLLREAICTFLLGAVDLDYSLLSSQFPLIVQVLYGRAITCTYVHKSYILCCTYV